MKEIKLTWLGHSCFKVEEDGFAVVFDPMKDGSVPGVRPVREKADLVLCSHGHGDHNAAELIDVSDAKADSPFRIYPMSSYHDDAEGRKRGMNTIYMLDDGTMRIAHMGDIGCDLTDEQIDRIRGCDLLMIPVGGFYTIDCRQAHDMVGQIDPKVVIPMHYRSRKFGYDQISGREEFVELIGNDEDREIISRRFICEELPKVRALLLMEPLKILR